jgi:MraZ protein
MGQKTRNGTHMQTFVGNIEGRLDEKGRIFVPAVYRKILSEADSKRIVMRRDTDNECLMFYPEQVWNEKVAQLRQALDEWDPEDQLILMQFMADAEYMETDGQGRILLQKKNLETIGAQQDVLFVGMLDRFALWAPEKFAEKRLSQSELAARLRAKMKRSEGNR